MALHEITNFRTQSVHILLNRNTYFACQLIFVKYKKSFRLFFVELKIDVFSGILFCKWVGPPTPPPTPSKI